MVEVDLALMQECADCLAQVESALITIWKNLPRRKPYVEEDLIEQGIGKCIAKNQGGYRCQLRGHMPGRVCMIHFRIYYGHRIVFTKRGVIPMGGGYPLPTDIAYCPRCQKGTVSQTPAHVRMESEVCPSNMKHRELKP